MLLQIFHNFNLLLDYFLRFLVSVGDNLDCEFFGGFRLLECLFDDTKCSTAKFLVVKNDELKFLWVMGLESGDQFGFLLLHYGFRM